MIDTPYAKAILEPEPSLPSIGRTMGLLTVLGCILVGPGCTDFPGPEDDPPPRAVEGTAPAELSPGEVRSDAGWDRELVFVELDADSTLFLPWHIRAYETGDSLRWERSLRSGQAGRWNLVIADTLTSPRTRSPWRILAQGPVQVVVEVDDVLSSLILEDGVGEVHIQLGEFLVEWSRPEGGAVRLHRAESRITEGFAAEGESVFEGIVLDLTRAWGEDQSPPGDWILLQAELPTQFFFEQTTTDPDGFRGWSRIAFQTRNWPVIDLVREDLRPFEQARRDIPGAWSLRSPEGDLEGRLEAISSHLTAGEGAGPLLPVTAYFEVAGEILVEGELIAVHGIIRHVQR